MRDREARAQRSPVAAIECEQRLTRSAAHYARHPMFEVVAYPRRAKPFAFETKKGNFIIGIDGAQSGIELDAVDNPDRFAQMNVLRTQVTVSIDDAPGADARCQQLAMQVEKPVLQPVEPLDSSRRHA
jgi:hypothetical protein